MNKILAAVMLTAAMVQPAAADDRQVFGAIVGAVIGYELMRPQQPQIITVPQHTGHRPVYDERQHIYIDRHQRQGRCWTRLDRINSYGQPVYMQECRY